MAGLFIFWNLLSIILTIELLISYYFMLQGMFEKQGKSLQPEFRVCKSRPLQRPELIILVMLLSL